MNAARPSDPEDDDGNRRPGDGSASDPKGIEWVRSLKLKGARFNLIFDQKGQPIAAVAKVPNTASSCYSPMSRYYVSADLLWSAGLVPLTVKMRLMYRPEWVQRPSHSPSWLTAVAVILAGRKRTAVRDEWRSHLYGWPGRGLSRRGQVRAARGFLLSAVRYRLQDAADLAWRPVDAVLRSRGLSNLFTLIPTVMAAMLILRHEGTLGMVTSAESISAIGGGLYGLVRVGRWWRDVKPPEPKVRAKEL